MPLTNRKIFLSGATGMVGISILRNIFDNFPTVKVVASYHKTPPVIKHKQVEYVYGDLRMLDDSRRMMHGCDCAIMAAAHAGGAAFAKSFPWEHMRENLFMNMQMLDAFRLEGVKRIIFIGSATLYQEFEGNIKEDELDLNQEPHDAYFGFAWGMRFIEKLCKFLNRQYGTEVIIVRASNIFGPYAKFDPETSNFIPAIIRKAIDKIDPFEVWGSPEVTRDVIYSDDFARVILMLAGNDKIKFDVFNIGSGLKTTVGDVVEWALKYAKHEPREIRYVQDRPTAIKFRALDCFKAKALLGWEPQYTIEEGIRRTTEWWSEHRNSWRK